MNSGNISAITDVDELFRLRSQLLMDPNSTQEQFDNIDAQLLALGVEPISAFEVAQKFEGTAQPLYDAVSTDDTLWTSQRLINVYNGKQYNIQIITGQMRSPTSTNSPLYHYEPGIGRQYSGVAVGAVNAIQVIAEEIITAGVSSIPVVGTTLSNSITLYDIVNEFYSGLSPITVLEDASYSFDVLMVTTMRFAFIKYEGALDAGNQILGCVGNFVDYTVSIDIPIVEEIDGQFVTDIHEKKYSDCATSAGFDIYDARAIASKNFWDYKLGQTYLDQYHQIYEIPIVLLDCTYDFDVPYSHP